jgi:hypothetical protein
MWNKNGLPLFSVAAKLHFDTEVTKMRHAAWVLFLLGCGESTATPKPAPPTPPANNVSDPISMMHARVDELWDAKAEGGKANLRVLLQIDGKPLAGEARMESDFVIVISGGALGMSQQPFNPNKKGRFLYEGLAAGEYKVEISSPKGTYKTWTQEGVKVAGSESPLLVVSLSKN